MKKILLSIAVLFAMITFARAQVANDVLSQWKFDETSGTTVTDAVSGGTGEIQGSGVVFVDGVDGGAFDFSATSGDAVLMINDSEELAPINFADQSFSVSVLVKVDPSSEVEQTILIKGSTNSETPNGNGQRFQLATKNNNIYWAVDDDVSKSQLSYAVEIDYPVNEWAHYVGTRNVEDDSLYFYLNGEKVASLSDETGALDIANQALVVGNFHTLSSQFYGSLDDLKIIEGALSDSEVKDLYNTYSITSAISVKENNINLFPNPVSESLLIKGVEYGSKISIFSATGQIVAQQVANKQLVQINTAIFKQGVYILKVENKGVSVSKRFVKR